MDDILAKRKGVVEMVMELVTPKAYAKLFGVSEQTVTRLCREKEIKSYRIGRSWRIPIDIKEIMGAQPEEEAGSVKAS